MKKQRFDLIPPHSLAEVAKTLTIGAEKHAGAREESILNAIERPRADEEQQQMASLLRHLNADRCGERRDADGFEHLAAVAARAMMILELRRRAAASPAQPS